MNAGSAPRTIRLDLAYDGTEFRGWAAQPGLRTVQGELTAALATFVPDDAVVRHDADQSGPARYGQFLRTLADAPCIVVGRRSAVYASAHDVGLVAIWDDGDSLLSEQLSPGVHARDAALVRQELEGSALLFAGHTRTTDVQRLVEIDDNVPELPVKDIVSCPLHRHQQSSRISRALTGGTDLPHLSRRSLLKRSHPVQGAPCPPALASRPAACPSPPRLAPPTLAACRMPMHPTYCMFR